MAVPTIADTAGNALATGEPATDETYTLDNTAPTVAITGVPAVTDGATAFTATFTFDEAVTGFDAIADITTNGTATAPAPVGASTTVYTSTITPNGAADTTVQVPANAALDVALNGNTISAVETATLDNTAPTLTSFTRKTPATSPTNADTLVFLATFSEDVVNVGTNDFSVNGSTATVTNVAPVTASTYDITVSGGDLAGFNGTVGLDVVAVPTIADTAGNALATGEPATDETYTLDNTAPTVSSITGVPAVTDGATAFTATFTFDEAVTGFDAIADITTNGTATAPAPVGASTTVYTSTITPNGAADTTVQVPANAALDVALNGNTISAVETATLDNTAPTVSSITGVPAVTDGTTDFVVTITFDEAVTGFDAIADITTNGTATAPAPVGASTTVYTSTITPNGAADTTVQVPANAALDVALNGNTISAVETATLDNTAPTVSSITGVPAVTDGTTDFVVTITFDEAVTGFDAIADITTNGTATAPAPVGASTTVYTSTITPNGAADTTVQVPANAALDVALNGNTISAVETATLDNTAPTLTSFTRKTPATSPTNADTLVFLATFSEDVVNVGINDFSVNGSTATITNVAQVTASTYDITVSGGDLANFNGTVGLDVVAAPTVADTAGNALVTGEPATDETYNLQNDLVAPDVAITAPATVNGPFTATFTFTEPVNGFALIDIVVGNGTASVFTGSDGDSVFTALITPTAHGDVTIDVAAGVAQDLAGNNNTVAPQATTNFIDEDLCAHPHAAHHCKLHGTDAPIRSPVNDPDIINRLNGGATGIGVLANQLASRRAARLQNNQLSFSTSLRQIIGSSEATKNKRRARAWPDDGTWSAKRIVGTTHRSGRGF